VGFRIADFNHLVMIELLSKDMRLLVDNGIITVDKCVELMHKLGGLNIHIPTISGEILRQLILAEYDGENLKQLAMKYRRSERTIYAILASKSKAIKQESLFDAEG
jgi:Mor family transcriptional regulator